MIPQTARARSNKNEFFATRSSPSARATNTSSFINVKDTPETIFLRKELNSMKNNLKAAFSELDQLKLNHSKEIAEMKSACEMMKTEIETLRSEKTEALALQNYGTDDYSLLAKEVIRLRTELDRVSYLYTRERRMHSIKDYEDLANN